MRIKYIDALRGFTMFLVVFMHVMILSFGVEDSVLSVLFKRIRMPMFFFISGYIGFKTHDKFTRQGTWELLKKKSFVQLVPTFIFFSIYKLCTGGTPLSFFSEGLLGYWFTLSLFELFLIYYVTSRFFAVLSSHGGSKMQDILYMMLIMTTWAIGLTMAHDAVGGHSVINVLNLQNTFVNMPFFLTGLLVRKHWQRVLSVLQGPRFFTSCIVIFLAGSLLMSLIDVKSENMMLYYTITSFVLPLFGVSSLFGIFHRSADYFEKNGFISRAMQFTGRRTLDIYLLHYFILPDLKAYTDFFMQGRKEFFVGEIFIIGAVAISIIMLCLLFSNCMRKSEILAKYMFGILPKNKGENK